MSTEPVADAPVEQIMGVIAEETPEKLTELITAANLQYSLKNYDGAAEIYSQAAELQVSLNGEMDPKNAELLYLYGRCLFKVAVAKSDVLGGQASNEVSKSKKAKAEGSNGVGKSESGASAGSGLFQVMESDDEDAGEDEDGDGEDDEDDFGVAFEILDVARVLYKRQMEEAETEAGAESMDKGKGKATAELKEMSPELKKIKERLADTYDLQAEIALENERFEDAVEDSRSALHILQQIEAKESKFLAEAHYKLGLALEFSFFKAVREAKERQGQDGSAAKHEVQPTMLYEAVENQAAAIISCELRISQEESKLSEIPANEAISKKKDIQDVKEIVQDMMTRLADLKSTVKSMSQVPLDTVLSLETLTILDKLSDAPPPAEALKELEGLVEPDTASALATVPGETAHDRQARIQEAASKATDLSGLVRHKKKEKPVDAVNGSAKRKVEEEVQSGGEEKKVRIEA